jgi:N-acetylglucosaminyldiphosphoundecaprenol N-acetyl-beta-D-mannosaminyltransferase
VPKNQHVTILGMPVGALNLASLVTRMEELIATPGCATAYAVNAHALNLAYRNPQYFRALTRGDLIYADGFSVVLAARVLGGYLPEKLTTTDVWPPLCESAIKRGYRFFLLGGEPGLAERARTRAMARYPGLKIVGAHHGYFDPRDPEIVSRINAEAPDILWVGMGDPRQVLWTDAWRRHLKVNLVVTCGGMFKIVAEELERIPHRWRQRGFEWVYRLWQEPHTWKRYCLGLPVFGMRLLAARWEMGRKQGRER